MRVTTKARGVIEVDERQRFHFPRGLLGFETLKDYALLDGEKPPYYWLQSLDNERVAFILLDPFLFRPDYELDLSDADLESVGIRSPGDALIFAIVTAPPGGAPLTANLQGPLVINRETRRGFQAVLSDPRWQTRHDIMAELARSRTRRPPC